MAIMFNCATDWTFDLFMEDVALYKATPIKGVHCRKDASDRENFMVWLKNLVRDFRIEFEKENGNRNFDGYRWIGDYFKRELCESGFSDFYKDTYGQRPHLDCWYYVYALGLPSTGDDAHLFCASPIESAISSARLYREIEW